MGPWDVLMIRLQVCKGAFFVCARVCINTVSLCLHSMKSHHITCEQCVSRQQYFKKIWNIFSRQTSRHQVGWYASSFRTMTQWSIKLEQWMVDSWETFWFEGAMTLYCRGVFLCLHPLSVFILTYQCVQGLAVNMPTSLTNGLTHHFPLSTASKRPTSIAWTLSESLNEKKLLYFDYTTICFCFPHSTAGHVSHTM